MAKWTESSQTQEAVPADQCRWCGGPIRMMCQKNTGFCCALHEKAHERNEEVGDPFD